MSNVPRNVPPGPAPRTGALLESLRYGAHFFFDPFGFVGQRFDRYGDVYCAPAGDVPLFVVRHPDHVREVLVTRADTFAKSHSALESLSVLLGEGLLTTDGEVWRRHRRILNPAFSRQAIAAAVPRMVQESRRSADELVLGAPFDVTRAMTDLTLRIVGHSLLGIDLHDEVLVVGRALDVLQTAFTIPRRLPRPFRWPVDRLIDKTIARLDGVIERVIHHRQHHPRSERDLLQMLLDATDPENHDVHLTPREVRDELVTFLLAGHETTSNTLAWALYLLAKHPEVLREAQQEVDRVLAGRDPTSEDLEALHLLDAILKETMRLYPPAFVLARRAIADTTIGPWPVARGSEVVVWTYFTHRDPRFFPDPMRFDPARFTDSSSEARTKLAYLPFGAGARACIGKVFATVEAKVALAVLLSRFGFELRGPDRVAVKARLTLTPKNLALVPIPRS
jgi:cytochrome P450